MAYAWQTNSSFVMSFLSVFDGAAPLANLPTNQVSRQSPDPGDPTHLGATS
jgi:hypothetical protein